MSCLGRLSSPFARPGFIVSAAVPSLAVECAKFEACLGSDCSPGYTGNRCARCAEGTYRLNNACEPCGDSALIWSFGVVLPCIVAIGAFSQFRHCSFFLGKAKTEAMYFSSIYLYRNLVASSMLPHSMQLRAAFGMQSEAGVTCPYFKIDKARLCSNNR